VLLHCAAGASRSGSIAVAWRSHALGESVSCALACIQRLRPVVEPNVGFLEQLLQLEREGLLAATPSATSTTASAS
jgi:protein-tyrosine phosphatase